MANKMLIDASHPEETRVVVLRGNRVQEFDFEAADKKPLRGNIYLAKVTRVEPSLQAAFVDYGGNRHGFLAFAEIHPDYYQIPVADRQALIEEESRAHREHEEEEHRPHGRRRSRRRQHETAEKRAAEDETLVSEPVDVEALIEAAEEGEAPDAEAGAPTIVVEAESAESSEAVAPTDVEVEAETVQPESAKAEEAAAPVAEEARHTISVDPSGFGSVEEGEAEEFAEESSAPDHELKARRQDERDEERERAREENTDEAQEDEESSDEEGAEADEEEAAIHARAPAEEEHHDDDHDDDDHDEEEHVEHIGGDAMDEAPFRVVRPRRQYKIQEVIKRRQVLLVQVVKEERGNKGAALTTYLSLAGRYSVLMPNTARGGGISRKITDGADRKRLKEIVHDLEVPEGMGVILRTAGATRTKAEVKRDFEYLLRLWESVRELTLRSSAPMLVYEEGSLIKRAIRDLYGRDVEEIVVSGDDAYREAKDFMRMLMPSHAKNVKQHREPVPIFAEAGVEAQLDAMFSNNVTLKSGGYLVINQTEALVAIDVNSGRSTREHNIEDTALRTNLEAADEVARQLRLRDLAGLIVVDFIDMEESRNNRAVERRLKDALKNDRARIQVGRISHFGLLEMSRQRIRAGVVEGSTVPCPHCAGAGHVRSTASVALHVLRVLEEALLKSASHDVTLRTRAVVALYILNQKRSHLQAMENRFGVHITVAADDTLTGANYHALERGEPASGPRIPAAPAPLRVDSVEAEPLEEEILEEEAFAEEEIAEVGEPAVANGRRESREPRHANGEEGEESAQRSRRRRRRRGRGGGLNGEAVLTPGAEQPSDEGLAFMAAIEGQPAPREAREPRATRGRGPGRWRRSAPLPDEFRDPSALFPSDEGAQEQEALVTPREAHMPDLAPEAEGAASTIATPAPQLPAESPLAPTAPEPAPVKAPKAAVAEVETQPEVAPAEPVSTPPAAETPAPSEAAAPAPESVTPRKPTEVVITKADPSAPKKGGWWQRVKTPFGE
ncbi:Rne/Rng family ribonuclease [Methylocystis sp. MJC1]|uniref:Rne/Rng family ribonuclease n=1 Tax=Methylocystis sp. MJC1 TaxID=2654282 RepID=UPI0013ED5EDC|nr:ribonuclease E/G [Methylocystis sp. MJC1]KAF2990725.1 Ribonuclease E [Methylocystis sp. MJC1]MBU6528675.1 Rne/Rng family ribonuclease [Methylocystis sp. MJC1]UZX11564.1 Rne/Rng family ribonuclease [Methylocystis sp. MJC1]